MRTADVVGTPGVEAQCLMDEWLADVSRCGPVAVVDVVGAGKLGYETNNLMSLS
jgi:hypothetical protein